VFFYGYPRIFLVTGDFFRLPVYFRHNFFAGYYLLKINSGWFILISNPFFRHVLSVNGVLMLENSTQEKKK